MWGKGNLKREVAMTKIEWTEKTWNPIIGCSKVSEGCKNCYAETIAKRFWGDRKFSQIMFHIEKLNEPLMRKKPTMYFVNSMSDLFHEYISFLDILKIFRVMERTPQHTYQILTKRPEEAIIFFNWARLRGMEKIPDNIWLGVSIENQ